MDVIEWTSTRPAWKTNTSLRLIWINWC